MPHQSHSTLLPPFLPSPGASLQIKCYLKQLFCGLALLANYEVLHRDLKNANLLVNNAGELKIADFGLARYFHKSQGGGGGEGEGGGTGVDARMTNRVITLWYRWGARLGAWGGVDADHAVWWGALFMQAGWPRAE
jgi:serine/threonine protein kinase